jgi:spore maturation protein CgeB
MIHETVLLLTFPSEDPFAKSPKVRKFLGAVGFNVAPTGQFDRYYRDPLEKIFSRVITYEYTRRIFEIGLTRANQEVVALVRNLHPKYVVWLSSFYELLPSTFDAIRSEGTIVVGWFFDDEIGFETYSRDWISHLDYFVTNDKEAVAKYRALGAAAFYSLPCVGEGKEDLPAPNTKTHDVVFVGRRQPGRDAIFERWEKLGLVLETFGPGWGSGPLTYDGMLELFRTTKVNLNVSVAYSPRLGVVRQLKARPFEVCLAGGFLLTDDAPGLSDCFRVGEEIACYSGDADLIEKSAYYLSHEDEREGIARRGWQKARSAYSSSSIIGEIFGFIQDASATAASARPGLAESGEYKKGISACMLLWAAIFLVAGRPSLCVDALGKWVVNHPLHALKIVPSLLGRAGTPLGEPAAQPVEP